ncbi:tRNA (32-2'-O)-methyltransferase regulator THADA [Dermatophagoides pteronyssinus]|uniref:tRNA (32-2'-O)-methyltransferase regulator THADA n=1 Tax=Dermatophagoides pteronyssinus TaxID=6956 RepID=UPI003F66ADC4
MFNLPGSRKNNGQKTIMKKLIKKTKHLTLIDNENFGKILSSFQIFFENESKSSVKNINLNHCIRQLLSALKSLKFISKPTENNIEINSVVKCWNHLRKIYCDDDIFPETAILSAFCTPFILINFLMIKLSNINHDQIFRISFVLYARLFAESIEDENEFNDKIQNIIKNNPIIIVEDIQKQIDRIATKTNPFCQATFYYGILNCVSFFNILISDAIEIFDQIFNHLIRLCRIESKNTFQIYRLLNQYLKLLVDHQCMIEMEISNNNNISKYFVTNILEKTLSIVDSEWESPINGAITLMKENYQFLIKFIIQTRLEEENFIQQILTEQLESASQLPFTSKAKYKKLAVLTENLSLQTKNIQFKLLPGLPFKMDSMFSCKVIKHLSITAITTSIADYYKSSIFWIVSSAQTEDDQEKIVYIQEKWSQLWLIPITQIFKTDQIQFMIVHNILMASILPSTLQHIPESMNLMMTKLSDCPYGQVCLIRIYLEKYSQISTLSSTYQLPSIKWLITILTNYDDMIRVEGLALLCDEKLIRKNRPLVCDIILRFLRNNLNVDNCSFRQRMIRVLERFFYKIITCLCDRYGVNQLQPINEEHKNLISFISNTLKLLAISLLPGSSFQRKFTALNLIAAIITLIKNGDYHLTIRRLLTNNNDHNQQIEPIPIRFMLLYGIIDKDDKIRRLTNEILNQYSKTSLLSLGQDDAYKLFSNNWIECLYIHYSRSFRHQECHIGGLLCKYLINIDPIENIHHIFKLVNNSIELFYSDSFRKHMLQSSQSNPLHGWLLTLNQCLDFDNLAHHLFETKSTEEKGSTVIRSKIVEPIINLCFDVLEYFLELLTPKNDLDIEYDEDGDDENFSSPSFLEMSESIKEIIQKDKDFDNYKDFTSTNEFQLILSMCWLNMKESCFLIANLSTLSADLLCCLINRTDYDDIRDFLLLSAEKLCQSVNRMANLMQRCRHRGVIEACSISLTKFTRSFLRIHFYLHQILDSDSSILHEYRLAMKNFVEEILAVITRHKTQLKTSVTRRSAGLALIIQSVLIGEAESFQKDKTKLSDGNSCQKTLYDQFIDILINISQSPIDNNDADEKTDLQQANAMHVLRSILGTSVLSQMNYKTAEILFPICLNGFISPYWQIRNASLQLFGACITRLLGQKKRTKSKPIADHNNDDDDNDNGDNNDGEIEESTITMNEFYSRYPNLLKLICQHLQQSSSSSSYEDHRPEIVPVLALTASFTSFAQFDESKQLIEVKNCLKNSFIQYIECNRCWKIRMLAAKSLTNLSTLSEMNEFLTNSLNNSTITSNHYHGLLYCAKYMIEQKSNFESNNNNNKIECYRQTLCKRFEQYSHTIKAFYILRPLFQSIFHKKIENLNNFTDENESIETTNDNIRLDRENDLQWIFERTSFKNADNIRLLAAKQMNEWLRKNHNNNKHDVQTLILIAQILLALFEDEDRTVRFESLKIGEILFKNHQIISTNITIDMFIDYWLIEKNPNGYRALFKLILKRFEQSLLFIENVEQMNDILFEKEEKNVFAEPYLINIRLLNSFINHSNLIQEIINEEYDRNEFEKLTQRFYKQLKINDHYKSYRNDIMFKALLIEPDNLDHQKQTSLIIDNNPFYLQELCKEFNTIKMDLIHFEF